jgi:hypothetical protein
MAKGAPTSNRRARVAASRKAADPVDDASATEAPEEDTTSTEEAGN